MWKDTSSYEESEIEGESELSEIQKTPRKFLQQKVPSCGLLDVLIAAPNLSGKHINKQSVVTTYAYFLTSET